jgi:hypothetical protein
MLMILADTHVGLHLYCSPIWTKFGMCRQCSGHLRSTKFHENLFCCYRWTEKTRQISEVYMFTTFCSKCTKKSDFRISSLAARKQMMKFSCYRLQLLHARWSEGSERSASGVTRHVVTPHRGGGERVDRGIRDWIPRVGEHGRLGRDEGAWQGN